MNHRLVILVGLFLGAACLTTLAGIGVVAYKLECVQDQLQEIENLQTGPRLQRLEMQHAPERAAQKIMPQAVAE